MKKLFYGMLITIILGISQISYADSVDNALKFCSALDTTGMLSTPCNVSGSNKSIDVTIDTSNSEARKICRGITAQAYQVGAQFEKGWKVRIYSPYGGVDAIAQCYF